MVLSRILCPVYCFGYFDQLLWTCHGIAYSWKSLQWIVVHIYNMAFVAPLTVHFWQQIINGECSLPDCDDGCNRLELAHDMQRLYTYTERFLISLVIFPIYLWSCSNISKYVFLIIIGINDYYFYILLLLLTTTMVDNWLLIPWDRNG